MSVAAELRFTSCVGLYVTVVCSGDTSSTFWCIVQRVCMYRGMVCRVELSIINMKIEPRPTVEALITIYVNADRYHTTSKAVLRR